MNNETQTYRPYIDGLRAIAILAVVLFHARVPGFGGGFVGVDVFFVISGYLIIGMLANEVERTGRISIVGFYERRLRRLAPALIVVLLATLAMGALFLTPVGGEQTGLAKSLLAVLALVSNVYFMTRTGGYFDERTEFQPLLHTWSLSVEEQFYLFWPITVLVLGRLATLRGIATARAIMAALAGTFAASLCLSIWLTPRMPEWAFYLPVTRAWEFVVGGMACLWLRGRAAPVPGAGLFASLGMVAVVVAAVTYSATMEFPGYLAAIPVFGATAIIVGCDHAPMCWCARLLSSRPFVLIGLLSYSWYLWHWPLLSIARINSLEELDAKVATLLVLASLGFAWLTYRFIEDPIRRRRVGLMATRQAAYSIAAMGTVVVAACAIVLGVWSKGMQSSNSAVVAAQDRARWRTGCDFAFGEDINVSVDRCKSGAPINRTSGRLFLIWGDSHAREWRPYVEAVADAEGASVSSLSLQACPPLIGFKVNSRKAGHSERCAEFNSQVISQIRQTRTNRVYIAARWPLYAGDAQGSEYTRADVDMKAFVAALIHTAEAIGPNVEIEIIGPIPELKREAWWCIAHGRENDCAMSRVEYERFAERSSTALLQAAQATSSTRIIDPTDYFCDAAKCYVARKGQALYFDDDHVSSGAARRFFVFWKNRRSMTEAVSPRSVEY